ncbi:hypothetical protein GCM10022394_35510 [Zobellella aerophila]|uniref:Uncharacterized protein n=2 Tax=Zobellella aerophila TaxID=870480 RepID=A0ABP6WJJ6_9GAMM
MSNKPQLEIQDLELLGPFTSQKGKQYYKQVAYLHVPNRPYPDRALLYTEKPADALRPGFYDLHPEPWIDKFGGISYSSKYIPSSASAPKAVANG